MTNGFIYALVQTYDRDPLYVGQTLDPIGRLQTHRRNPPPGIDVHPLILDMLILEEVPRDQLLRREAWWLTALLRGGCRNLVNGCIDADAWAVRPDTLDRCETLTGHDCHSVWPEADPEREAA